MNPYWRYPGVLNGRITPIISQAPDGSYVFCLGDDCAEPQIYSLNPGDVVSVHQTMDMTGVELIYFYFQFRNGSMPSYRAVVPHGLVDIKAGGLIDPADALIGLIINDPSLLSSGALFQQGDTDQLVKTTNFLNGANNTTCRITAVPVEDSISPVGRVAIIENAAAITELGTLPTVEVLGAKWVGQVYIDAAKCVEVVEYDHAGDPGPQRDLAVNVSKLNGFHTLKYVLELQSVTS